MIVAFIISSVVAVLLDQLTKLWLYGKSFSLLGDFLWVESTFNKGAAFGSFAGARWLFIGLAVPVLAIIIYLVISKKLGGTKFLGITLGMLFGGIVGNLIDRIFLAGVRDFIYFKFINFAIFNIADAFITIGTIMLIVYIIFLWDKGDKQKLKVKS